MHAFELSVDVSQLNDKIFHLPIKPFQYNNKFKFIKSHWNKKYNSYFFHKIVQRLF